MAIASHHSRKFRRYASLAIAVSFWANGISSPERVFPRGASERTTSNVLIPLNRNSSREVSAPARSNDQPSPTFAGQTPEHAAEMLGRLPIRFEANLGQTDPQVKFIARGGGGRFFLTPDESVFVLRSAMDRRMRGSTSRQKLQGAVTDVVRMKLLGGNEQPELVGENETPGKSNYFIGNEEKKWLTDVPIFSRVRYREVLPGIDMVYHGEEQQLEYDFEMASGADPDSIKLSFTGVVEIKVTRDGDLSLRTRGGEFLQRRPYAFQEIDGQRARVPCDYVVRGRQVGFKLGNYDKSKRLVIDPVLVFSTYLGGSGEDGAYDITLDDSRNIYITGQTVSTNFPTVNPFESYNGGMCMSNTYPCFDVFVTKLDKSGQSLIFSTYVGGTGEETGLGITIDSSENVYVAGKTASNNFPALGGGVYKAAKTSYAYLDAFMFKLTSAGNSLPYGTYINGNGASGSGNTYAYAVALDSNNKVWVAGTTASIDFPMTGGGIRSTYCKFGGDNGFLVKIDPDPECKDTRTPSCPVGPSTPTDPPDLLYSTYVCGSGGAAVLDMALDPVGNVWLAGEARINFPTTLDAFQPTISDPSDINEKDGFAAKISASGTLMLYATYLGGTSLDKALGVATDGAGNAYVVGSTSSSDFPTTPGAFDTTIGTLSDGFVAKFLGTGLAAYSTFLGGNNLDEAYSVAADASGHAYVTGATGSSNFPITPNAHQPTSASGPRDAFLTKLSPDGSALDLSTYLGGSGNDYGDSISLDSAGNAYLAGYTSSSNFPTTANAYDTSFGGGQVAFDAFVSKLSTETFAISGRVTDSANLGFNGVAVNLTGSRTATTLTDVSGNYSFEVPSKGNYTVAVSRPGFTFTPVGPTTFNNLLEDKAAYFSTTSAQPVSATRPQPLLADATVQDLGASASANYGTASELLSQVKVTVGMNRESYLKFDISNFDSATSVKLRLFGKLSNAANSNIPASVFSVANTSWDEKTITWNNKPASGSTALATTTVTDTVGRWYEWDVTSYVNAERAAGRTLVSFVQKNDTGSVSVTRFNSREAGENTPRLESTTPSVSGALPTPWVSQDVGTGMTAGNAQHLSGVFTVRGAGNGVIAASTSDAVHFVHQQISGDFRFSARVSGLQNFGTNPRAGITMRASLAPDAPHASLLLRPSYDSEFFTRTTAGAANSSPSTSGGEWIMLMRSGTELRGYTSSDGVNWFEAGGPVTFTGLTDPVYIGLAVTSGNSTDLVPATFDNVTITPGTPNPPPQVSMRYPNMAATFNPGTNIPLSANATDPAGGTISQVQFLAGTTVVGTATTPTSGNVYDVTWNNVAAGLYSIQARATDNGGGSTTSSPVTISVNPGGAVTLYPTDDAYVQDGTNAANNFGTDPILYARTDSTPGSDENLDSYLKFDTTTVSNVTRATLRVYCYTPISQIMTAYAVSDTSWSETGITWNNKPTLGAALRNAAVTGPPYRFHDFDVTDYVQTEKAAGRQIITLALHAPAVIAARINMTAKETTTGGIPELLLTTSAYKGRAATGGSNMDGPRYAEIASHFAERDAFWSGLINSRFDITTERPLLFSRAPINSSAKQAISDEPRFVPDELLIQYEEEAKEGDKDRVRGRIRAVVKEKIKSPTRRALERGAEAGDLELVKLPRGQSVRDAIDVIKNQPGVKFAEPNLIYELQTNSNDTHYLDGSLWNMYGDATTPSNQYGSEAGEAWGAGRTGSTTVYVGVIDQGVQVEHPDLRQNAWTNSLDLPGDGVDNDGNGFVDDTFGWDFANGDNTVFDGNPTFGSDDHGTHVTGTVTAVGGNGTGVAGVTWRATFIPAKAILNQTGKLSNIIKAIDYITDLKVRHGVNIVATNNSYAGQTFYSQALLDAIVRGAKANILFIAAAENGGRDGFGDDNDLVPIYPSSYDTTAGAGYDAVISVASIASDGTIATSSNYGPTSVDLGAPGHTIFSTIPTSTYGTKSGTSMATPHVTGAAALYASMYRTAPPSLIKKAILGTARVTPITALNGRTLTGGRLNVSLFAK